MIDPQNLQALEDLRIITGFDIQPAIASEEDIFGAIAKIYRERAEVGENLDDLAHAAIEEDSITDIRDATEEAPDRQAGQLRDRADAWTTRPATSTSSRRPRS